MQEESQTIDMETLIQEWKTARTNRENFTSDFPTLDNIVDGVPITHQEGSPYVGDTTLAGLVRSIPRSSLQQLPIFSATVNGTKQSIKALICSYLLRRGVFNKDTFGKGLLSTVQIGSEQALTHGYAPFMTATGTMFNDYGTTMRLLHFADVDPEPGIQDANEAGFFYVAANLTKSRVRKIRDAAMNNPNTSWDVAKLNELLDMEPVTKIYSIYESDPRAKAQAEATANTYEFVTRYETGKEGEFVTFCPQITDAPLRVIKSRSKFGYPRVQFLVIDPAALSPFGVSRVRLASPNQNLMNIYYQNIASMLLLNSKPPILKRGRFTKPVQLKQGAVWEALDQNAKAELMNMDNGALAQFVPMAQQMTAQIQNMMGSPRGNVGGGANALGYSKTAPGVKAQREDSELTTNQITHILENFLRQYALVALDTYISERTGEDTLIVDDECKNAINRLAEAKFKPSLEQPEFVPPIGEDNKIVINWEEFYNGKVDPEDPTGETRTGAIDDWTIEIELSMGKDELDEKKRADLQDMLVTIAQNAEAYGPDAQSKVREITDMLLEKSVPESKRLALAPTAPMPVAPQPVENAPVAPPMTTQ